MSMKLGTISLNAVYLGTTSIAALYLGAAQVFGGGAVEFDPASLFASGEEGAWYEPSVSTAFTDTTATTAATYGDPVAFLLDKSQGAGYADGSFTGLGSELVANGDGSSTAGWLIVNDGGASSLVSTGGQFVFTSDTTVAYAYYQVATEVGKTYTVSINLINKTAGVYFRVATFPGGNSPINIYSTTLSGVNTYSFVATTTAYYVHFGCHAGESVTFDDVSVRELPGNHATQTTLASRPILARVPEGGRRNLLISSEFDALATIGVAVASSGTVGENTLFVVTDNTSSTNHFVASGAISPSNGQYTSSVNFEAGVGKFAYLYMQTNGGADRYCVTFNLETGAVDATSVRGSPSGSASIVENGSYYTCAITFNTVGETVVNVGCYDGVSGFGAGNQPLFTGDGTNGFTAYGWQFEAGAVRTGTQKVVTSYDITEAGVTSLEYLSFDGVDDWLTLDYHADQRTSDMTYLLGMEQGGKSTIQMILSSVAETDTPYVIAYTDGDASTVINGSSGSPTTHVNNGTSLADRNAVFDAVNIGSPVVLESRGFDMTTSAWVGEVVTIGQYRALSFNPEMKMFNMLILANHTSGQISDGRQWVADQIGATL